MTSETTESKTPVQRFVMPLRSAWASLRHATGLFFFVAAFLVFIIPCVAAAVVFAVACVVCFAAVAIGGVLGCAVAIPAIVITPNGVKTVIEASKSSA